MKRSTTVVLILSGAVLTGCSDNQPRQPQWGDNAQSEQAYTNNTYVPGRGYYHAPYYRFYPYPYNSYVPGSGYYHGGTYASSPDNSGISSSKPIGSGGKSGISSSPGSSSSSTTRGGFTRSGSSSSSHGSSIGS